VGSAPSAHPRGAAPGARARRFAGAAGRLALGLLRRGYAAALIALILWVSWRAIDYLIDALVTPIRPPTVPVGTARLRFAFTAMHPDEEIARLADAVRGLVCFPPTYKGPPACPPSS